MPSVDQLQVLSPEKISKHKLTSILHDHDMWRLSMKFSDGSTSPSSGNYEKTPDTEVAIPD